MFYFSSWWSSWWFGVNKLGALNAYAMSLPEKGPYDSTQLGMLKQLDEMVSSLEMDSGVQVHLTMLLRQRAMSALPEDTAALLEANLMSSEVALELVRRNMTEYSQLSSGLTGATAEDLEKDPVLKKIHDRLSMAVELHGTLTLQGITPTEREWAKTLSDTFVDLRSLRATPWSEVAWLLGLVELSPELVDETAGPDRAAKNTFDNPPTDKELRIIEELYSIGDGAPPIRAQVLSFRMSLDVADELESMNIYDASQMTANDQRKLLFRAQQQVDDAKASDPGTGAGSEEDTGAAPEQPLQTAPLMVLASDSPVGDIPQRDDHEQDRSRALPLLAARLLPVAAKVLPKLGSASKLTSALSGGKSGLASLERQVSAMKANASGGTGSGAGSANAKSGLVQAGAKLDEFSSTVNSATGAVQSLKGLYKELTPDVEAEVAAIEEEKARLSESIDFVREELKKVDVTDELRASLNKTEAALEKAKAQVAPDPDFGARIAAGSARTLQQSLEDQRLSFGGPVGLGSYASNEELVAKASGGLAMYGMNYFPTTKDIVLKPYSPILQMPSYVEMTGAVSPFEAKVEKTTSTSKAAAFHNTSSNAGISVAETVASTKGTSSSASAGIFAKASASGSTASASTTSNQASAGTEQNTTSSESSTTSSATIIEYIRCPMKSFRIPVSQMDLTPDAFAAASLVDTIEKGEEFLDAYGSHVSTGRQELGGIFYSTITLTSQEQESTVSMMSAASKTSETIKTQSSRKQVGGGVSVFGFGGKASTSFGKSTSTGETKVSRKAKAGGISSAESTAQYESYVRCVGPNTPTPEAFAEALFTDTSTWAITDRGRLEAMVPVTVVIQKAIDQIVDIEGSERDEELKDRLQMGILFIKAAWRRRAKYWGYLLNGDPDLDVPTSVANLIKSASPSSLGRVPTLLGALLGALIIRHRDNIDWKGDKGEDSGPQQQMIKQVKSLAQQFAAAADEASTNSNSFPVELPFLDVAGLEKQVTKEILKLRDANKASFGALGISYDDKNETFEVKDPPGNVEEDLKESWNSAAGANADRTARKWEDLEEWQQQWLALTVNQGGKWDSEGYQLFQRRFFIEETRTAESFLKPLRKKMAATEQIYFTVKLSEQPDRTTALQRAVSGMAKLDWAVFKDSWIDDRNTFEDTDDDELGPEGEALWQRLVMGANLFAATTTAQSLFDVAEAERDRKAAELQEILAEIGDLQEQLEKIQVGDAADKQEQEQKKVEEIEGKEAPKKAKEAALAEAQAAFDKAQAALEDAKAAYGKAFPSGN